MNPARREALRLAIETAKKRHAPRSHLTYELKRLTVQQLQAECPKPVWPTLAGEILHETAALAGICFVIGSVLAIAAVFSGVK